LNIINALSVDLEDWFCVYNFSNYIHYSNWDKLEHRIIPNTIKILNIFDKFNVKATFFVLGWIADRFPDLIKEIYNRGHEISSHGYSHRFVLSMKPEEFEEDIYRSLEAINKVVSTKVKGFRAPSFSIKEDLDWIYHTLLKYGFEYDSSIYPTAVHPDYANSVALLNIHQHKSGIIEFPMSCFTIGKLRFPCSGGGYFRLFPYSYTKLGFKKINKEKRPAIFYIHPWEIDPEQPKIPDANFINRFRHYFNISKTEERLHKLLSEFKFDTVSKVIGLSYKKDRPTYN